MLPLNHKGTASFLAPPIIYVAKKLTIKRSLIILPFIAKVNLITYIKEQWFSVKLKIILFKLRLLAFLK